MKQIYPLAYHSSISLNFRHARKALLEYRRRKAQMVLQMRAAGMNEESIGECVKQLDE